MGPAVLVGPHPPNLDHPPRAPGQSGLDSLLESLVWTLRFLTRRAHQRIFGQGTWVWVDPEGVLHR